MSSFVEAVDDLLFHRLFRKISIVLWVFSNCFILGAPCTSVTLECTRLLNDFFSNTDKRIMTAPFESRLLSFEDISSLSAVVDM